MTEIPEARPDHPAPLSGRRANRSIPLRAALLVAVAVFLAGWMLWGRLKPSVDRSMDSVFRSVAFSPDGRRVIIGLHEGTILLWPADPVEAAERSKPRDLTAEERRLFEVGEAGK